MLANDDIFQEIKSAETVRESMKSEDEKAKLKMLIIIAKLLHNMRTNMVKVMKAMKEKGYNIDLESPKKYGNNNAK